MTLVLSCWAHIVKTDKCNYRLWAICNSRSVYNSDQSLLELDHRQNEFMIKTKVTVQTTMSHCWWKQQTDLQGLQRTFCNINKQRKQSQRWAHKRLPEKKKKSWLGEKVARRGKTSRNNFLNHFSIFVLSVWFISLYSVYLQMKPLFFILKAKTF